MTRHRELLKKTSSSVSRSRKGSATLSLRVGESCIMVQNMDPHTFGVRDLFIVSEMTGCRWCSEDPSQSLCTLIIVSWPPFLEPSNSFLLDLCSTSSLLVVSSFIRSFTIHFLSTITVTNITLGAGHPKINNAYAVLRAAHRFCCRVETVMASWQVFQTLWQWFSMLWFNKIRLGAVSHSLVNLLDKNDFPWILLHQEKKITKPQDGSLNWLFQWGIAYVWDFNLCHNANDPP